MRAEVVHESTLHVSVRETMLLVLTVNREKMRSDPLQSAGSDRHVIDPCATTTTLGHLTAENNASDSRNAEIVEDRSQRRFGFDGEDPFDVQPIIAGSNQIRLSALTSEQLQRFNEQEIFRHRSPR